jgi:hypothetical protein
MYGTRDMLAARGGEVMVKTAVVHDQLTSVMSAAERISPPIPTTPAVYQYTPIEHGRPRVLAKKEAVIVYDTLGTTTGAGGNNCAAISLLATAVIARE